MSGNPLEALSEFRSWQLHRLSPTTYPSDINVGPELRGFMRAGTLFRCRISRGPWAFGLSAKDAIEGAVTQQKVSRPTKG